MTLVPFNKNDIDDIEVKAPRIEKITDMLISFITSDHECVEVTDYPYNGAMACRSAIGTTITRCGLIDITVRQRGHRIFLIKEQ